MASLAAYEGMLISLELTIDNAWDWDLIMRGMELQKGCVCNSSNMLHWVEGPDKKDWDFEI